MKVTVKTVLPHSPEVVFDFVADMHNDPQWAPMVTDVQQVEGDGPEVGARWTFTQQMGRHQVPAGATMVAYDRPRHLAWRADFKAMDYHAEMWIEPHPKGCRLRQTNTEVWHFAPWHLKLIAPGLVKKALRRQLALLAKALENKG